VRQEFSHAPEHFFAADVLPIKKVICFLSSFLFLADQLPNLGATLPLNDDGLAALARLWDRAQLEGSSALDHFVFPACENGKIDPTRPQKSWRSAWRALTKAAGIIGFRFHDLRHQAITEMAEAGATDATIMAVAGHMDRAMMEHYSHVRMAAKRNALDKLSSGLMGTATTAQPEKVN
jgi:integrase